MSEYENPLQPGTGNASGGAARQVHHEGWDTALDAAITDFETNNSAVTGEFEAEVTMTVKFEKRSPGWVGEYSIKLDRINRTGD